MKKGLTIALAIFLLLTGAMIAIPFLFRDTLLEMTRKTISRNLLVTVDFEGFKLSLLKNFPKAGLYLENVQVIGTGPFAKDTLLLIGSLSTKFGILDLLSPGNLTINELILNKASLNLLINKDNLANWDIIPETKEKTAGTSQNSSQASFGMELSKIEVTGATIRYRDVTMPLNIGFHEVDLSMKGNLYGNDTRLRVEGEAGLFTLAYDSASYIDGVRLDLSSLVDIDFGKWLFSFSESELQVNGLPFDVGGNFSMPGDSLLFDLEFASPVSDLAGFLKLVPPMYEETIKKLHARGEAEFAGSFKGLYYEESYPALKILFTLAGGNLRYEGFSEEIKDIYADFSVLKPQGGLNLTSVDISRAHAQVKNNPVDFSLKLDNLLEDLRFSGKVAGRLNFDHLKDAIPMDSMEVSGILDLDLGAQGTLSAIERKDYNSLKTDGTMAMKDFIFSGSKLAMPVMVAAGKLDFDPGRVNLQQLDIKIGQSDLKLTGSVSDYYPYLFASGTLSGSVRLTADFLNLNELMLLQTPQAPGKKLPEVQTMNSGDTVKSAPSTFKIPENLNLSFETDIDKALYDRIYISHIKGRLTTGDGRLNLSGLTMNLLEGEVRMAGIYENRESVSPAMDLNLDVISFDIPAAFQSLKLIKTYLPVAAQSKGKFSTSLKMNARLNENMELSLESLNGSGLLNSYNVQILNSPVFNKIKSVLREETLRDIRIDDFAASFTIENGNLMLKPFKTKIGGQEATLSGQLNAKNLIDMHIGLVIAREALSENIENTLGLLPGQKNIRAIPVEIFLSGPAKNPEVKIDLSEARTMIRKEVGGAAKEDLKKVLERVGDSLKKIIR